MNLNELQRQRAKWVAKNFPDDAVIDSVLGAVEELGELAHHMLKRKQGIRGDEAYHTSEIRDAVADCIIFLAGVAQHEGFQLGDIVSETWALVKQRDWTKEREQTLGGGFPEEYQLSLGGTE